MASVREREGKGIVRLADWIDEGGGDTLELIINLWIIYLYLIIFLYRLP